MKIDTINLIKKMFVLTVSVFALFLLIPVVAAVDNTYYDPTCVNVGYDDGYSFIITENGATEGNVTSASKTGGYLTPTAVRVYDGTNILCAVSDSTSVGLTSGSYRVFGTSEDGSVWYTDTYSTNYSLGFFSLLYWNPTVKIGTLSAETSVRKLALDSSGNVYTNDGYSLIRYVKSLDYTPQTFHTITIGEAGTEDIVHDNGVNDCAASPCTAKMLDIQIDSSDNIHMLWGDKVGAAAVNSPYGELHYVVLTSSGSLSKTERIAYNNKQWAGGSSDAFQGGGLVLDSSNSNSNYTYGYYLVSTNAGGEHIANILHNSTAGTGAISGGDITDFTSLTDLHYENYQIYASSQSNDIIRSYVTTFEGYNPTSQSQVGVTVLDYANEHISFDRDEYGNNSRIGVSYYFEINSSANYGLFGGDLGNPFANYDYSINLYDGNMETIKRDVVMPSLQGTCFSMLLQNCVWYVSGSYYVEPVNGSWGSDEQTFTARIYENYYHNGVILATDEATVRGNESSVSDIVVSESYTDTQSQIGISSIEGLVSLLGMGVSPVSKFIFAFIVIVFLSLYAFLLTRAPELSIGMFLFGVAFFTWLTYLPVWILAVIILAIVAKAWGVGGGGY